MKPILRNHAASSLVIGAIALAGAVALDVRAAEQPVGARNLIVYDDFGAAQVEKPVFPSSDAVWIAASGKAGALKRTDGALQLGPTAGDGVMIDLPVTSAASPLTIEFKLRKGSKDSAGAVRILLLNAETNSGFEVTASASASHGAPWGWGNTGFGFSPIQAGKPGGFVAGKPGSLAGDAAFHTVRVSVDPSPAYYEMKTQLAYDGVVKGISAGLLPSGLALNRLEIVAASGGPWLVDDVMVYVPDRELLRAQEAFGYSQAMTHKCERDGYDLELPYWQEKLEADRKRYETARLDALRAMLTPNGIALPADLAARADEIAAAGKAAANTKPSAAAEASWKATLDALTAVDQPYGWHTVKTHLLRDLANRCRRVAFYAGASGAADAEPQAAACTALVERASELVEANRSWENDYAGCFFGLQRQKNIAHTETDAAALAERAKGLATQLADLEARRTGLEKDVLAFLQPLDATGKFRDLGVPVRRPPTFAADGKADELSFWSIRAAGATWSGKHVLDAMQRDDPMCFDGVEYFLGGNWPFEGPGTPKPFATDRLDAFRQLMERGYAVKQGAHLQIHTRGSMIAPLSLLPPELQKDPDIHLIDAKGQPTTVPNIWHPAVRELYASNVKALGRLVREDFPQSLLWEPTTWEPGALGGNTDVWGYNPGAIAAFRSDLKARYGDIAALNKAWRTDYADFDAIRPPPSPFHEKDARPTALSYEFQAFRGRAWAGFVGEWSRNLSEADPGRPIGLEHSGITGSFVNGTVPDHVIWKSLPYTFLEDHHNNWAANYPASRMHYDLCRYAGKQPIQTEFIWTYPRRIPVETEEDFRVNGELSVWRNIVWGRQLLQVHGLADGWSYRHNYLDERHCSLHQPQTYSGNGRFVREAGTSIVLGKKRAREFWPYLRDTEVVKPKIALVVPTTSMLNEYPYQGLSQTYPVYLRTFLRWSQMLDQRDLDFRHVPEGAIIDGDENLDGFRVIILPYATYFPAGLAERLLAWVKEGGLLIGEGVPGVYTAHCFEQPDLMRAVFGEEVNWTYAGDRGRGVNWRWDLQVAGNAERAKTVIARDKTPLLVAGTHGKGSVLVSAEPFSVFSSKDDGPLLREGGIPFDHDVGDWKVGDSPEQGVSAALYRELYQAIGQPSALSKLHKFELVTREDRSGQRYLFVTNWQLRETVTDEISLDGVYARIIDLGAGDGCQVPIKQLDQTNGRTVVEMRLAPGEATCLSLSRRR
jgi:hypothetical protein